MKRRHDTPDRILDRVLARMRDAAPEPRETEAAARRVWERLTQQFAQEVPGEAPAEGPIRGCTGIRALLPAYVEERLPRARALLVEDHVRECVPCRKALRLARAAGERTVPSLVVRRRGRTPPRRMRWMIGAAAALVSVALLAGLAAFLGPFGPAAAAVVRVKSLDGTLLFVGGGVQRPAGPENAPLLLARHDRLRTTKDGRAVLVLEDGSRVEMGERTELGLREDWFGSTTIELERGRIIVQAVPRRVQPLWVRTGDCRISVLGTVFSVNRGTKGSRVSVIEGKVRVEYGAGARVLLPGEQVTTHPSLDLVPVTQEIAWSRNAERYAALLREIRALRRELESRVEMPGLRYASRLLDLVPEGSVFYAGIPNLGATVAQAHEIVRERIANNPLLRQWWEENIPPEVEPKLDEAIEKIRALGDHLGEEIVLAVRHGDPGPYAGFVLLAEVSDTRGLREFVEEELLGSRAASGDGLPARIVDDPFAAEEAPSANAAALRIWIAGDLLVVASDAATLRDTARVVAQPEANPFRRSGFHERLAQAYEDGVGWIFAADLGRVFGGAASQLAGQGDRQRDLEVLRRTGLLNTRYLIAEGKEERGEARHRLVLTFNGPRQGVASWLAAPAPMGALDFVSPEAHWVVALAIKDPELLLEDWLNLLEPMHPDLRGRITAFEEQHGVRLREELAAPLGGELVFALDGPVLPRPAWKLVIEVYDPGRLQAAIERLVAIADRDAAAADREGIALESVQEGSHTYHRLRFGRGPSEINYVFVDGYVVAGPSRVLLERAIEQRRAGISLAGSRQFLELLPRDGHANFSALIYRNLDPVLAPLMSFMGTAREGSTGDGRGDWLASLAVGSGPSLGYAYAYEDRIEFATSGRGSFGAGMGELWGLGMMLERVFGER